jgi:hypothetical protein
MVSETFLQLKEISRKQASKQASKQANEGHFEPYQYTSRENDFVSKN